MGLSIFQKLCIPDYPVIMTQNKKEHYSMTNYRTVQYDKVLIQQSHQYIIPLKSFKLLK